MARGVLGSVLPFAVGMSGEFLSNVCSVLSSADTVGVYVFDADGERVAESERSADLVRAKFSYNPRTLPNVELHTVRVDS